MKRLSAFDVLSMSYILLLVVLMLAWWKAYPIFIDVYYHLSVMRMFDEAGGIVLKDFMEFAPSGRPHLYPPLLHTIMLFFYWAGLSVESLGRLLSFALFPLQLLSLYVFMRSVFSPRAAFFSLLILSQPLGYLWANSIISASALVLFLAPLLLLAAEKGKTIAASILLAFSLYTHLGIAITSAFALLLYGTLNPKKRKTCTFSLIAGSFLYLPWGIHVLLNIEYLNRRFEGSLMDPSTAIHIFMISLAIVGVIVVLERYKKERHYMLPLCYLISMFPVVFTAPNRFWLSCGGLPFAMLGGVGLWAVSERMASSIKRREASFIFAGIVFLSLLLFNPAFKSSPQKGFELRHEQSLIPSLFSERFARTNNLEGEDTDMMLDFIRKGTSKDDVIATNHPPLGCLITAYTGRAQTGGMFHEVLPFDNPGNGTIFVIEETMEPRADVPNGKKIGEFGRFSVYEGKKTERIVVEPVVPAWMAFMMLFSGLALAIIDAFGFGEKMKNEVRCP